MRIAPWLWLLVFSASSAFGASSSNFYVKLDVTAPVPQRDTLVSLISQKLRAFPDVELVTGNATYELSVQCVSLLNLPAMSCGYSIERPFNAELWKMVVVPANDKGWIAFSSVMKEGSQSLAWTVLAVGFDRTGSLADDVVDALNAKYLEPARQAIATYERTADAAKDSR